jgi:hypothetical protein
MPLAFSLRLQFWRRDAHNLFMITKYFINQLICQWIIKYQIVIDLNEVTFSWKIIVSKLS